MGLKNKTRLEELIKSIKAGIIKVDTEAYSPLFEMRIQEAVEYKRGGQYDRAVDIYIDIFHEMKSVNSNIMAFLYKVILSAEEFKLAYDLIVLIEQIVILNIGPKCPIRPFPNGPVMGYIKWAFTDYKEQFLTACIKSLSSRNTQYLLEYVIPKSGNPSYKFSKSDSQIFKEISQIV